LYKLQWLFFPVSAGDDYGDGTDNLNIIYERLAERDAVLCKPSRDTEYACMGAADFIRNLLLGSFRHECDAIYMYKQYWLPIEQAGGEAARRSCTSGVAVFLETMLDAFLLAQPEKTEEELTASLVPRVGGQLYSRFRRWVSAAMQVERFEQFSDTLEKSERQIAALMMCLRDFAVPYLARVESLAPVVPSPLRNPKCQRWQPSLGSLLETSGATCPLLSDLPEAGFSPVSNPWEWRCPQCSCVNTLKHCTECLVAKPSISVFALLTHAAM
jgi:hypothetical protein